MSPMLSIMPTVILLISDSSQNSDLSFNSRALVVTAPVPASFGVSRSCSLCVWCLPSLGDHFGAGPALCPTLWVQGGRPGGAWCRWHHCSPVGTREMPGCCWCPHPRCCEFRTWHPRTPFAALDRELFLSPQLALAASEAMWGTSMWTASSLGREPGWPEWTSSGARWELPSVWLLCSGRKHTL